MAWWISLILLSMAALLWKKSSDSTDDVIALLERILATTLLLVVVLVSRNLLLETAVLIAAVQLPGVRGDSADLRLVSDSSPRGSKSAGAGEDGVRRFHGMAEIVGLEHFFAPFVAAVVGDRVLVQLLLSIADNPLLWLWPGFVEIQVFCLISSAAHGPRQLLHQLALRTQGRVGPLLLPAPAGHFGVRPLKQQLLVLLWLQAFAIRWSQAGLLALAHAEASRVAVATDTFRDCTMPRMGMNSASSIRSRA